MEMLRLDAQSLQKKKILEKEKSIKMEGKSLYCFRIDNRFRRVCFMIAKSDWFNWFITLVIVIIIFLMARENDLVLLG